MKSKILFFTLFFPYILYSQSENRALKLDLTLESTIEIASNKSLASFKSKNLFLSGYWQFNSFKAGRLPLISLTTSPLVYNQNYIKRYDSQKDVDVYKNQQSVYSSANLSLSQNVDFTGGTFFVDTELDYLRNIGISQQEQFSSIPFRFGYSQSLFGYNQFKWEKRIEPIHYDRVKKELLYNLEDISNQATQYFFDLALCQTNAELAKQNVMNSDSIYQVGLERYKVGSISHSDLLTLRLDVINSKADILNTELNLKESSFRLATYLQLDLETEFVLVLPKKPLNISISLDDAIHYSNANNPKIPELKENILNAQQNLEKTEKESRFTASLYASMGFNQVAGGLLDAYNKPLQQDMVSVGVNVPLVDWGVRRGKVNIAKNSLNVVNISSKQSEQSFEQEVRMAVSNFINQQALISLEAESRDIAELAYEKAKQLFLIGKTDVNSLNLAQSRKIEAEQNYITSLKNYWLGYFNIRKLTLYDFVENKSISFEFEKVHGF